MRQSATRSRTRVMVLSTGAAAALRLADRLAADGYEVATTATEDEALDVLPAMKPHVLVFDSRVTGPDLSQGVEAIRGRFPDLPLVAVVEDQKPEKPTHGINAGSTAVLLRPCDMKQIERLVDPQAGARQ